MGVDLRELVPPEAVAEVELEALRGKVVALDAYNMLYQFLAAIRQPDGTPLMDSKGRVTSHLSGLFYRTINLLEAGLRPVYVFDGKPPSLKERELERRRKLKEEAERKLEEARKERKLEEARRYAQIASKLTDEMVEDAKKLLSAMGVPWVQAPAEGEAQAAFIASRGDAWAAGSQDYDSILFGAPRLVRNLGVTGKRKLPKKEVYVEVKPEVVDSEKLLKALGLTREQLIVVAIMLGTDYNPEGVKGVGPKTALKVVKSYKSARDALKALPPVEGVNYEEIFEYFLNPQVSSDYEIAWGEPDAEEVRRILVEEHDFSPSRVDSALERLKQAVKSLKATPKRGLDAWL